MRLTAPRWLARWLYRIDPIREAAHELFLREAAQRQATRWRQGQGRGPADHGFRVRDGDLVNADLFNGILSRLDQLEER